MEEKSVNSGQLIGDFGTIAREERAPSPLENFALKVSAWAERWYPDAFVFAIVGVAVVDEAGRHGTIS